MFKIRVCMLLMCFLAATCQAGKVEEIKARGYLKCGVSTGLAGFSYVDESGKWAGFDVDFCRATAAAVLGDADKVEYTPLTAKNRFSALQSGEIDVLIRTTTWNFTRDAGLGLNFSVVNFYDGQAFMVPKSLKVEHVYDLDGASICMQQGTTTEINAQQYFAKRGLEFKPVYFDRYDQMLLSYQSGRCDAVTGDASAMAALRSVAQSPEDQIILPERISKEPLSVMVKDDDANWLTLTRWVVWATLAAEELEISQKNLDEKMLDPDQHVADFLQVDADAAAALGVSRHFTEAIVREVGNYGEIFARHLGKETPFGLERGQNALWRNGGLMYPAPFN